MRAAEYVPDSWLAAAGFLREQLAGYPGRANVMLRCTLTCAIVIVTSMTLEVPSLALSLLVVFFVTQSNVAITRFMGLLFIAGSTLAIGTALLLLKYTYDYPLLRIVAASALFAFCVYMMRVCKLGPIFYVVAITVIYVQSFVDQTDLAELLVRSVLWTWVAINYPIALTLLINGLLLPVEPLAQLKDEIRRQLAAVSAQLAATLDGAPPPQSETLPAVQRGALTLQKLLGLTAQRDARFKTHGTYYLACIATVSRLYRAARDLALPRQWSAPQLATLREIQANVRALDAAVEREQVFRFEVGTTQAQRDAAAQGVTGELHRALHALSDDDAHRQLGAGLPAPAPLIAPDALTNPVYARFTLKTLLAVLICYVFYNAADWQGAHTIMLTCVIVALPNLGASTQRALLRVAGAMAGSALALLAAVFVIPHLDGIVGLLMLTLPVIALAAWIGAGPERISYAGTQMAFTFSLALLDRFGPSTDLTEIRDRMVGIALGVTVATVVQMSFWREGEGDALRVKLAGMLRAIGGLLAAPAQAGAAAQLPYAQLQLRAWSAFNECEATLARVALEPGWQESAQEALTLRAQTLLAQGREIMLAGNGLHNALAASTPDVPEAVRTAAQAVLRQGAEALADYAGHLASRPADARTPHAVPLEPLDRFGARDDAGTSPAGALLASAHTLVRQLSGLPDWDEASRPETILRESHRHEQV